MSSQLSSGTWSIRADLAFLNPSTLTYVSVQEIVVERVDSLPSIKSQLPISLFAVIFDALDKDNSGVKQFTYDQSVWTANDDWINLYDDTNKNKKLDAGDNFMASFYTGTDFGGPRSGRFELDVDGYLTYVDASGQILNKTYRAELLNATLKLGNSSENASNTAPSATILGNPSLPTYNATNTYAQNLISGSLTGSAPVLPKNSFDYKFYNLGGGRYGVQEKGSSKIDEITGASSLKFADQTLTPANDVAATFNQVKGIDDVSGVVFRLYNAAFSRLPDANGLQNWINGNAAGTVTYASSAQSFSESQEFKNRYGSNVTDTQFITTLYNNVLGRAPDAAGLSHYQSLLAGGRSRGALLLDFSESPENRVLFTQVTGLA
jgi:hypothetical protein